MSAADQYKGVRETDEGHFRAFVWLNGKSVALGTFKHAIEAARAYDECVVKEFGPDADLNFPGRIKSVPGKVKRCGCGRPLNHLGRCGHRRRHAHVPDQWKRL